MRYADILSETYTSLSANKVRSGLTTLGIVIGIASVIAMVSIGQGVGGQIESSIQGLGSNLLTIMPGSVEPGRAMVSSGRGSGQSLKNEDIDVIKNISDVTAVSAEQSRRFQVMSSIGNNTNTTIIGVTPEYESVRNVIISSGSFVLDRHLSSLSRVAVLGSAVAVDLFGENEDSIGKTIRINKSDYKVIGVLQQKGGTGFFNPDDTVYVPLYTMQKVLAGSEYLSTIAVSVKDKEFMEQVKNQATEKLAAKHKVDLDSPDFSIISQSDILSALTQVTDTFTLFLSAVAGISLLVGGIGIMNMILTTVTERTREIGLRKAIGAKAKDITLQFLTESIVLTLLGGVIGVLLGWGISIIISAAAGITTTVSLNAVLLAFGVSAAIGVLFGYYPARRASRLNPMDALRYE
jgi:putative ABC transport system permease protein